MVKTRAQSTSNQIRFHATLLQGAKTATGIHVPDEVVEQLGAGKRPAVHVTINGHSYRSTVAVMGGRFMLGVSAENRVKANVSGGDAIDVTLELDTAPREIVVPPDFMAELRKNVEARARFEQLSFSKKQAVIVSIESAKAAETRARRIRKVVDQLR